MSFEIQNHILFRYKAENQETHVIIPDGVEIIGRQSFFWSKYLEVLTIPPSVRVIENNAFERCRDLKEIRITEGIEHVEQYAFRDSMRIQRLIYRNRPVLMNHVHICMALEILFHKNLRSGMCLPEVIRYDMVKAMFLEEPDNKKIIKYMQKDFLRVWLYMIENNHCECLEKMLESGEFVNQKNIDTMILYAIKNQKYQIQLMLTDYKRQKGWYQEIDQKLKL